MPRFLKLTLAQDEIPGDGPNDYDGGWKLRIFRTGYAYDSTAYDVNPNDYAPEYEDDLAERLAKGLAFFCRGRDDWNVGGDYESAHGVVEWVPSDGPDDYPAFKDDYAKMRESADAFLTEYSMWARGEVYGYTLETIDGEHVDSRWGFIGTENLLEGVNESLRDDDRWFLGDDNGVFPNSKELATLKGHRVHIHDADNEHELVNDLIESIDPEYSDMPDPILRDWLIEHDYEAVADIVFPLPAETPSEVPA